MIWYLGKCLNFREFSVICEHGTHGGRDLLARLHWLVSYSYYPTTALDPDLNRHDPSSLGCNVSLQKVAGAGHLQHGGKFDFAG